MTTPIYNPCSGDSAVFGKTSLPCQSLWQQRGRNPSPALAASYDILDKVFPVSVYL